MLFIGAKLIFLENEDLQHIGIVTGWGDVHFTDGVKELVKVLNDKMKKKEDLPTFLGIHPKLDEAIGRVLKGERVKLVTERGTTVFGAG